MMLMYKKFTFLHAIAIAAADAQETAHITIFAVSRNFLNEFNEINIISSQKMFLCINNDTR